jgi:ubiquinol oxidase
MPLMQGAIVTILDAIYTDRHYARFYMLETIARVPYFGGFRS